MPYGTTTRIHDTGSVFLSWPISDPKLSFLLDWVSRELQPLAVSDPLRRSDNQETHVCH